MRSASQRLTMLVSVLMTAAAGGSTATRKSTSRSGVASVEVSGAGIFSMRSSPLRNELRQASRSPPRLSMAPITTPAAISAAQNTR